MDKKVKVTEIEENGSGIKKSFKNEFARKKGVSYLWFHLNYPSVESEKWMTEKSRINPIIKEILVAEEIRPRLIIYPEGILLALRGVNMNPGAEPEDMVSVRVWIEADRIITAQYEKVLAINDMDILFAEGKGPTNTVDFIYYLCEHLTRRVGDVIEEMDDRADNLEERVLEKEEYYQLRPIINNLRRQVISLRRYLAPQREVIIRLQTEPSKLLTTDFKVRIREIADRMTRYIEDLDLIRDRAALVQDELENRLNEQMNRNMYALSLVATLFLPLSFIAGLLGINVGGIPFANNPNGFYYVCGGLVLIVYFVYIFFRRKKLM